MCYDLRYTTLVVLFSLCVEPSDSTDPTFQDKTARSDAVPGVVLHGNLTNLAGEHHAVVTAQNEGPHTYRVSNICTPPWQEELRDPQGAEFNKEEPRAYCEAFGLRDFKPQEALQYDTWWNETRWKNKEGGRIVSAGEGTYSWKILLDVWETNDSSRHNVPIEFHIHVA